MGVIDAIAEGFFAVARRPWVLLPLVLLDLLYWLGGRLSAASLFEGMVSLLEWAQRQNATLDPGSVAAPSATSVAEQVALLRETGQQTDLLQLLSVGQSPLLPKLAGAQVGRPWGEGIIDPGSAGLTILCGIGLLLAGLLWFALTLAVVGMMVRDEPIAPLAMARRWMHLWARLLVLAALIAGVVICLGVPFLIMVGFLQLLGLAPLVALLALVLLPVLLAAWVLLSRTTDALAVSDVGAFRAIKLSVRVVRRNFWAMVRLFFAGWVISLGFPLAWAYLARQVAGVPLAVVGNAYLNTGLLAAAMIFYRECLAALERPANVAGQRPLQRPPQSGRRDRP